MTRRMLINTRQSEELRVALADDSTLFDFDIESKFHNNRTGNIYLGTISRVEPSLNAAFVSYGSERHGFLPFKEILPSYLDPKEDSSDMKSALKEGTRVIIQVNKDERGNKGAAVSTFITLAGCYLVIMPDNERAGGISRRIEGEERQQLKDAMRQLKFPKGIGVICRTAGLGRAAEELQWDLDVLLNTWSAIKTESESDRKAPFLIYRESDVIQRSIRDYLKQGIDEIVVDTKEGFDDVSNHIKRLRPDFMNHLKLYEEDRPLFAKYRIENQIESAYSHEVTLPSGGSIVFDHAEALTAIDINSARATKGGDIEETALHTNLEAAAEIAKQARLRDLGGLIVIDFIDMLENSNARAVEDAVVKAFGNDRARVQFGRISRFGLFEMSRQRLRPSLKETTDAPCPRCEGRGLIRSIESITISILRHLTDEVLQHKFKEIHVQLPVEVATFMLNEKRAEISKLESMSDIRIALIPNPDYQIPQYAIRRHKKTSNGQKSYELKENISKDSQVFTEDTSHTQETAVLQSIEVPEPPKQRKIGLLTRIWQDLFGEKKPVKKASSNNTKRRPQQKRQNTKPRRGNPNQNRRRPENPNQARPKGKSEQNKGKPKHNNERPQNKSNNSPKKPERKHDPVVVVDPPSHAQSEIVINIDSQPQEAPKPKVPSKPKPANAPAAQKPKREQTKQSAPDTQKATDTASTKTETKKAEAPAAKKPRKGSAKASDILAKTKKSDAKLKQSESKASSSTATKLSVEATVSKTKAPAKQASTAKKAALKQVETKK